MNGWPAGWLSVCMRGKNWNVAIFSVTTNMTVKLCMMVVLTKVYLIISLSVTLIYFKVIMGKHFPENFLLLSR